MAKRKAHPAGRTKMQYIPTESPAWFQSGVPLPDNLDDLAEAYGQHVWVFAGLKKIVEAIGSLPIYPYRKQGQTRKNWIVNEKHPFYKLITKRPNSFLSAANLKEYTALSLFSAGMSYWSLTRLGNRQDVLEIIPINANDVKVVPSTTRPVDHYIYTVNGKKEILQFEDVIYHKFVSAQGLTYGQSVIAASKLPIVADIYAQKYNEYFFKNNARPDALFETDQTLSDPVRKRIVEGWNERFRGVNKRGGIALMEGGLKYKEVNRTPKDLDFLELRKMSREEILAALGVPPVLVGVFEYANYANSGNQIRLFWENTIIPIAKGICDTLTLRTAQLTGDDETEWDYDPTPIPALQKNLNELATTGKIFVDMGVPPKQVIEALDLPFQEFEGWENPRQPAASSFGGFGGPPADDEKALLRARQKAYVKANPARASAWRRFETVQDRHERAMIIALRTFFRAQKRRVLAALEKNGQAVLTGHVEKAQIGRQTVAIEMLFDQPAEEKIMSNATEQYIRGPYADFAIRTGKQLDPEFVFDLQDPRAVQFIRSKTLKLAHEVNEFTENQTRDAVVDAIQAAVSEGFEQGEAIQQIADRIEEIYDFAEKGRADRIARTETIGAANAGAQEGMRATGAAAKEWLSARDATVRESHEEMDGVVVPVDQPFTVGGAQLDFPGDPSGPPEEIINCRCTVIPVVKEDEE